MSTPDARLPAAVTAPRARIRRLSLTHFRSYAAAQIDVADGPVVLTGPNGAGKTNVLEAVSFFSPGRGLRRAPLDAIAQSGGDGAWAVAAQIEGAQGLISLGTGSDGARPGARSGTAAETAPRRFRVDRESVSSANTFLDHLKVVWLTPEMDGLFIGPPSDRRRFLDRLVLAVDASHGSRVNALERALRSRNRVLEDGGDARMLGAVEHELAELAVAVSAARLETVHRLAAEIAAQGESSSPFPFADISLDGALERMLAQAPAVEVEDRYRALLQDNRPRDRAAGRTLEGPHLCDLIVAHGPKALPAARCSTGEQKSLLIGLSLSHARLVTAMQGLAPVVLLDDVVAYLDADRRAGLFAALAALGAQVWMTAADPLAFEMLPQAERFTVSPGTITRAG